MSEYQYYEFVAVDRSLSREEMAELRSISSRAQITPTRFTNFYDFGNFKGDEIDFLERFFDAHVYVANWGTHLFLLGFPERGVDVEALKAYQAEGGLAVHTRKGRVIVTFESQDEEGGGWVDEDESEGWMGSLIPLRADILNGDHRALYLGWLRGVQEGVLVDADEEDDDEDDPPTRGAFEPPVPPGLRTLSGPLNSLVEFLELDQDLVAVAAERSEPLHAAEPSSKDLEAWVQKLPDDERNTIISRLLRGENQLRAELLRRFRDETAPRDRRSNESTRRTAGQLLDAARNHGVERERKEAEAAEKERIRRAEEAARAQEERLKSLAGHERAAWHQVEELIDTKDQIAYDRAVILLKDLAELAKREDKMSAFTVRFTDLRARHRPKSSLMRRFNEAGLPR